MVEVELCVLKCNLLMRWEDLPIHLNVMLFQYSINIPFYLILKTFWITHPNNDLINNAAAGSPTVGIWYIFPLRPTGKFWFLKWVAHFWKGESEQEGIATGVNPQRTAMGRCENNSVIRLSWFYNEGPFKWKKRTLCRQWNQTYPCKPNESSTVSLYRWYEVLEISKKFLKQKDIVQDSIQTVKVQEFLQSYGVSHVTKMLRGTMLVAHFFLKKDRGVWVRGGDFRLIDFKSADNSTYYTHLCLLFHSHWFNYGFGRNSSKWSWKFSSICFLVNNSSRH